MYSAAGLSLKKSHEMIAAHVAHGGHVIDAELACKIFVYIRQCRGDLASALAGVLFMAVVTEHDAVYENQKLHKHRAA